MNEIINIINIDPQQPAISIHPSYTEERIRADRVDKILSVVRQSKQQGFAVRFWEGIIEKETHVGISKVFKKIVQWAKDNNLDKVIIGEGDILFSAPGAWQYYLKNMPIEFDIYSGGIYSGQIVGDRIVNGYSGNTLITVHNRFYDFLLNINPNDHLDRALGNYAYEKEYKICIPFVVTQMGGFSERRKRKAEHEGFVEKMPLYGR